MSSEHKEHAEQQGIQPKRLVLFVGGFDPRGARHYHQMMCLEAAKQAQVTGASYHIGRRTRWPSTTEEGQHAGWEISSLEGGACDYVFVDWSDVVRSHWPSRTGQVVTEAWRTYATILKERTALKSLSRETPYTLWTLSYPLVYMLLCMALAFGAFRLGMAWPDPVLGFVFGTLIAGLVLLGGYKLDQLLHVSWLLRILNFAHLFSQQPIAQLQTRMEATAETVAQQMNQARYSEVAVVGFSVGSVMAIPLVHALRLRLQKMGHGTRRLNLLTLGNCIPLFSLMPQSANGLRQQLLAVAQDEHLDWVDISSPGDSVSFGMCHLLPLSLPAVEDAQLAKCVNPRYMCSPRFHKLFKPSTYRWLRRNKMRMHFQYLMAAELPGAYDYFALLTFAGQWMDFISKRLVR